MGGGYRDFDTQSCLILFRTNSPLVTSLEAAETAASLQDSKSQYGKLKPWKMCRQTVFHSDSQFCVKRYLVCNSSQIRLKNTERFWKILTGNYEDFCLLKH